MWLIIKWLHVFQIHQIIGDGLSGKAMMNMFPIYSLYAEKTDRLFTIRGYRYNKVIQFLGEQSKL